MSEYTSKHSNEPQGTNNQKSKILYYVLIAIAAALLLVAIIMLCVKFFGGREDFGDYKNLSNYSTSSGILPSNPINFDKIREESPDTVAWISIPGIDDSCSSYPLLKNLPIDYPIMQSSAEADDNFYLDHDRSGKPNSAGAIYIQKLNHKDFSDQNTLIYGHNMLNGTMFAQLKKFRNKEFFDAHRKIIVYTPGHILEYEIISAFVYDNRHILNSFNFNIENECQEFFNECINPNSLTKQVLEDATLTTNDKIITLSTCTSNDSERYLVVGKLVSDTKTAQ